MKAVTLVDCKIGDNSTLQYVAAPYLLTVPDSMSDMRPVGLELFALAWLRQSYQTHIAWVTAEVDELARLIETESEPEMPYDAERRITGVLAELRLSAITTMDSNHPVDILNRSISKLMSQLRYELSEHPQAETLLTSVQMRLNDYRPARRR